jgi:UDP-N-acetylmuramoyl-L-alanyl-D-glutamate--2,6-diaminopimelate ligase
LHLASTDDIIVIAGKGHEDYQEVEGFKHPFDDRKVALELLKTWKEAA